MNKIVKDIVGNRYGRLVVLEYVTQDRNRHSVWKCQCDCGNLINVRKHALVSGNTTSCGCYNTEVLSLPVGENSFNRIYRMYKRNAEKRGFVFLLDKRQFSELIFSDCYYCGQPPSNYFKDRYANGGVTYNGIDRLNSSKGYEISNVVSCCADCNYAKRKMTVSQFVDWIDRISSGKFFLGAKSKSCHM